MELSVVIPSFGLEALLQACLTQLQVAIKHAGIESYSIVVVDNGSDFPYDRSKLECAELHVIRTDRRVSFARACNLGAAIPAERYLFLNNDVLLHPHALDEMMQLMSEPSIGICGTRLVYPNGNVQHCGIRMIAGPEFARHEFHGRLSQSVSRKVRDFQAVTGAVLLIVGDLFRDLNGFDEAYPFGYEDTDLCLRARLTGCRITCAQSVDSLHFESTSNKDPSRHKASRKIFGSRWAGRFTVDAVNKE